MASEPRRDPVTDHLLTPENSALIVIDYQPLEVSSVKSMDQKQLVDNIVRVARTAKTYGLPIVLSTVNVSAGAKQPTIPQLQQVLGGIKALDRTTINAWEDAEFRQAVEATGRRKLVVTGLWTEGCLSFPSLDALRDGYDVYPVVDAIGGSSAEAHRAALERIVQAGGKPAGWLQFICELQRDWARTATVQSFQEILFGSRAATSSVPK